MILDIFSEISLPLQDPVKIFTLILLTILFAPIILNKFKIPHLIGLIIAGAVFGPNGLNVMLRDSSIELFGTVGLLYIMFLAGIEIDLADFKKNSGKSIVFGLFTFLIPMGLGITAGYYFLGFPLLTSILLASMFASHTLLTYPIVSQLGISKNRAVGITLGGTMITDTLALLVLAVVVSLAFGDVENLYWVQLGVSVLLFGLFVVLVFPIIGRWFFKKFDNSISQYIFVLAMVFLGSFLAEMAGIEAIIGAFLAGLSLNRLIPSTSPLMSRVEFVGNAIFIPFFLIGIGMLVDFRVLLTDFETIKVAVTMTVIAVFSKFVAAWLTQKTFRFSADERGLIFGLSNAQAAATLAVVLVGYEIVLNTAEIQAGLAEGIFIQPQRLINESILNGTIIMILVTSTIASFVTQRAAVSIATKETSTINNEDIDNTERILIPLNNIETVDELVGLSLLIKSKNNKTGLYALNIIDQTNTNIDKEKNAEKILDKAIKLAATTDSIVNKLLRYDINMVNGITNVVKEHRITDIILGVHNDKGISENFFGNLTNGVLNTCSSTVLIYKSAQPISTIKRHIVVLPQKSEKEIGFPISLLKIWNIARNSGAKISFYATDDTIKYLKEINKKHPIECEYNLFYDWEDFLILSRDIKNDDNLIIQMSRKDRISYQRKMNKIPIYLNKYFQKNNYIIIYPIQTGNQDVNCIDLKGASVIDTLEKIDDLGRTLASIFKR